MVGGVFGRPPAPERPTTPGVSYGVPASGGELRPWGEAIARLRDASAYWLATVGRHTRPHVVPVWGVIVEDELYLEIGSTSTAKARNLEANPEIQVHLDGTGDVVIVRGRAEGVMPAPALGAAIAAAMHAKYGDYDPSPAEWDDGGLIRVAPRTVLAWRDMPTATRWRFADRPGERP
jgi:pyridoxine/pyridoxamine 5'-phosphate oxidase